MVLFFIIYLKIIYKKIWYSLSWRWRPWDPTAVPCWKTVPPRSNGSSAAAVRRRWWHSWRRVSVSGPHQEPIGPVVCWTTVAGRDPPGRAGEGREVSHKGLARTCAVYKATFLVCFYVQMTVLHQRILKNIFHVIYKIKELYLLCMVKPPKVQPFADGCVKWLTEWI